MLTKWCRCSMEGRLPRLVSPLLDTRVFVCPPFFVRLRDPHLDSETLRTRDFWSKIPFPKLPKFRYKFVFSSYITQNKKKKKRNKKKININIYIFLKVFESFKYIYIYIYTYLFFLVLFRITKSLAKCFSPPQELEVGWPSEPYLLVFMKESIISV